MLTIRGTCLLVAALVVPTSASAHIELLDPVPRHPGEDDLKVGTRCGVAGDPRSGRVTTYEAGQTIEVVWNETVNHTGHFRIAFDVDGDDDFLDPPCVDHCEVALDPEPPEFMLDTHPWILLDGIADGPRGERRATVTLPDVECDNCTLQVIQVMYDKRPYQSPGNDIYYQCADLVLVRSGTDAGPRPDAGGNLDGGSTVRDGGPGGRDGGGGTRADGGSLPSDGDVGGGCSCSSSMTQANAASTLTPIALMMLGVFALGRRRRRSQTKR
jgi:MYXO-CTERM domain-containing protein